MEATLFPAFHKPQLRARIELSAIVFPAAIQTRHRPFEPANPREIFPASSAPVKETAGPLLYRKWQGVAPRFSRDPEVTARLAPGRAMGWNAPAAGAELREEMRELVAQSSIDFGGIVFAQTRVERDQVTP